MSFRPCLTPILLGLTASFGLPGSAQQAAAPAPPAQPAAAAPAGVDKSTLPTLGFKRFKATLEVGDAVGKAEQGMFCTSNGPLRWNLKLGTLLAEKAMMQMKKSLQASGLPVPSKAEALFDTPGKPVEAALELGFLMTTFEVNICTNGSGSKGRIGFGGKWVLYNPKAQKVVGEFPASDAFDTGTERMPWLDMFGTCLDRMATALFARQDFLAAMAEAQKLPAAAVPEPTYKIPAVTPPEGGAAKNSTQILSAVVTLETNKGFGSGFYVSADGYLLTAHHVVKGATFVKVKTATGRELPGEVLGFDPQRDVALVKTAKIAFEPLALRLDDPAVGEEVYAIGSPLKQEFAGTMTRGVVSGFQDLEGKRYIQGDVAILPGNSGGPLVDAQGRVVGLAEGMLESRSGSVKFFIPVAEALAKLSMQIQR